MPRIIFINVLMFLAFYIKGQSNAVWQSLSKKDATGIIEHSKAWFQTTASYSFSVSYATYAGYESTAPFEKQTGYLKKYPEGMRSSIIGIQTIQNKTYTVKIDTNRHIILVNNPPQKGESMDAGDLKNIQKNLDKCTSIKISITNQFKILRLEFPKTSPIYTYEFCLNKEGLPKSIVICYSREVKPTPDGNLVKPKLIMEFDNYYEGISPSKDELNAGKYFYEKENVLALTAKYGKYTLLDQRTPTNKIK